MKDILSTAIFSNKEAENFPQKLAGKFSKTLTKTLRRLSDLMSDDPSDIDKPEWEKRVHKLRVNIEKKWDGLKNNFENFFKREVKEEAEDTSR